MSAVSAACFEIIDMMSYVLMRLSPEKGDSSSTIEVSGERPWCLAESPRRTVLVR